MAKDIEHETNVYTVRKLNGGVWKDFKCGWTMTVNCTFIFNFLSHNTNNQIWMTTRQNMKQFITLFLVTLCCARDLNLRIPRYLHLQHIVKLIKWENHGQ